MKHRGVDIIGIKYLVEAYKNGKYRSAEPRALLKETLGEDSIFGDINAMGATHKALKVAVTLTAASGRAVLVGNYNRVEPEKQCTCVKSLLEFLPDPLLLRTSKLTEVTAAATNGVKERRATRARYDFLRGNDKDSELKVWEA